MDADHHTGTLGSLRQKISARMQIPLAELMLICGVALYRMVWDCSARLWKGYRYLQQGGPIKARLDYADA